MQLLAIKEPQPQISSQSNKIAVGIDLGTTNSLIAISREGKIEIITSEQGERLIPSVVGYTSHGILVGSKAKKLLDRPEATVISSVKRLMGKGLSEATDIAYNIPINLHPAITKNDQIKLDVQGRSVTPTEVSAEILKSLKTIAEYQLNTSQIQAVITVPAYFDESARLATKTAAKLAGLEVLRLINEPTAAALAYGLDQKIEGTYLIYDLGGGTFDISILKIENGVFQVLATGGNVLLGGDDFDQAIVEEILRENPQIQLCPDVISHLLVVAKEIKESLSIDEKVHKQFMVKGSMIDFALTRKHFEFLIEKYIDETIRITENTICDANIPQNKINGIALVGGSTRLPVITEKLTNRFGITPFSHINPDEAVVIGAALQAENLTSKSSHLLLDVNPLSLGIEVMGGLVERIIPRNSPIPVSVTKDFTTFKDNQTGIQFHIVQGERELAKDCRSLARFELKDIPPMLAGMARITVNFTIDADGLLVVTAYEKTTNIEYKTTVNSSYGLSDKQIEEMLYDSLENAVIDVQEKLLIETKVEAESLIVAVNRALSNNQQNLDQIEKQNISLQLAKIKQALHSNDRDNLKSYIQSLERAAEPLIGKNLEMFLNEKVRGKAISDVYNSLQQDDENEK